MAKTLQLKRNSTIELSEEDAISAIEGYVANNDLNDGEILTSRYYENGVVKTLLGIVCQIYDDASVSIFKPDTVFNYLSESPQA